MILKVKLADKVLELNCINTELQNFFKSYLVPEDCRTDICLSWTEEEILAEQEESSETGFSNAYLETLAALRKIAEALPMHNRLLIHGASISYLDKGYLFTAPSGTGKSTHIRLWHKYLGDNVNIINGDKPFISLDNSTPFIYGNPWAGKEHWHRNCSYPLAGICFVTRGAMNRIRRLSPSDCLTLVLNQVFLPADSDSASKTLELIDILIRRTPIYLLECDMSEDAVRCSFEALTGLPYPI